MIKITGLQAHHPVGDVNDTCGDTVWTVAVNQPAIALLPQETAQSLRRANEQEVIKLGEIPLVEQELVKTRVICGQLLRRFGGANVEIPRDDESCCHCKERRHR